MKQNLLKTFRQEMFGEAEMFTKCMKREPNPTEWNILCKLKMFELTLDC